MSAGLSREDVERVAALAHLALTEAEIDVFTRQLAEILSYAKQIDALDTSGIPPTSHAGSAGVPFREDEPRPSLPRDEVLNAAPEAAPEGLFKVPRVLGT